MPGRRRLDAAAALRAERLRAPASYANAVRNGRADAGRHRRWATYREALWQLLAPSLAPAMSVAVLGAGNGDTVPVDELAARVERVTLIDLDRRALSLARRSAPRPQRGRIEVIEHDVTNGAADAIVSSVAAGRPLPAPASTAPAPLPGAPYDVVVGDLFYSQLLYPGLSDLGVPGERSRATLDGVGASLTRAVVARLHVSAPLVLHVHDLLVWTPERTQPVALAEIMAAIGPRPADAAELAEECFGPGYADPRAALRDLGIPIRRSALLHWPFTDGADYLVRAVLAGAPGPAAP